MKEVQICGSAPLVTAVPVIEGAERWILGAAYQQQGEGPWTRAFDVHQRWHIGTRRPHAIAWYAQQTKPIYLLEPLAEVPQGILCQRAEIVEAFGVRAGSALSSSIDWMIPRALLDGFERIHLVGIRMLTVWEWETQRECLAYWIGKAEGLGVEVITDPLAALCTPERIYGSDEPTGAVREPGKPLHVLLGA